MRLLLDTHVLLALIEGRKTRTLLGALVLPPVPS